MKTQDIHTALMPGCRTQYPQDLWKCLFAPVSHMLLGLQLINLLFHSSTSSISSRHQSLSSTPCMTQLNSIVSTSCHAYPTTVPRKRWSYLTTLRKCLMNRWSQFSQAPPKMATSLTRVSFTVRQWRMSPGLRLQLQVTLWGNHLLTGITRGQAV